VSVATWVVSMTMLLTQCAVEIGLDAEVEVGLRACDRGAEVVVRVPYLDDGGVIAVDVDRGRRVGRVRNRGGGFGKIWRRCDVPSDTPYADIIPGAQIAIPCLSTFWVIWHALDEVAVGFEGVRVASRLGATFGLCSMEVAVGATARRAPLTQSPSGGFLDNSPSLARSATPFTSSSCAGRNFLIRGSVLSNGAKSDVVVRNPFDAPSA
jgi:hypothetical protein